MRVGVGSCGFWRHGLRGSSRCRPAQRRIYDRETHFLAAAAAVQALLAPAPKARFHPICAAGLVDRFVEAHSSQQGRVFQQGTGCVRHDSRVWPLWVLHLQQTDSPGRFQPVHDGHGDVHEHDVESTFASQRQSFRAIARCRRDYSPAGQRSPAYRRFVGESSTSRTRNGDMPGASGNRSGLSLGVDGANASRTGTSTRRPSLIAPASTGGAPVPRMEPTACHQRIHRHYTRLDFSSVRYRT